MEDDILSKHAVDGTAERGSGDIWRHLAAEPVLHENAGDPVALLHARHAGPNVCHFTGSVGTRNERKLEPPHIFTFRDKEIAVVQRNRMHADQYLARAGFRNFSFSRSQ